jgi:hypothetical protein
MSAVIPPNFPVITAKVPVLTANIYSKPSMPAVIPPNIPVITARAPVITANIYSQPSMSAVIPPNIPVITAKVPVITAIPDGGSGGVAGAEPPLWGVVEARRAGTRGETSPLLMLGIPGVADDFPSLHIAHPVKSVVQAGAAMRLSRLGNAPP